MLTFPAVANRVFENLSFRANVIAYLKACVLYVANGCKWEPEIDEFISWSESYDLYCKMRFFGDMMQERTLWRRRVRSVGLRIFYRFPIALRLRSCLPSGWSMDWMRRVPI